MMENLAKHVSVMPDDHFIVTTQSSLTRRETQLRAIANNAIGTIKAILEDIADEIIKEAVENYDTAIPGDSYDRTGDLGSAWLRSNAYQNGDRIIVTITNTVVERDPPMRSYASLVQGEEQTIRHENAGWRKISDIQKDHSHEQTNRVRTAIRRGGR